MTRWRKMLVIVGALIVLVNTVMIAERIINPATASLFGTGQHDHPEHDHPYAKKNQPLMHMAPVRSTCCR